MGGEGQARRSFPIVLSKNFTRSFLPQKKFAGGIEQAQQDYLGHFHINGVLGTKKYGSVPTQGTFALIARFVKVLAQNKSFRTTPKKKVCVPRCVLHQKTRFATSQVFRTKTRFGPKPCFIPNGRMSRRKVSEQMSEQTHEIPTISIAILC